MWRFSRQQWVWALYDWGNSAFATTVMAGFFPLFFKSYWSAGTPATESTLWLGVTNSLSSLAVAICVPWLGMLADRAGHHHRYLLGLTLLGVVSTAALAFLGEGAWIAACVVFGIAAFGFVCSNSIYDALIVSVAQPQSRDRVSALGYSMGYLGGGVLFVVNVAMTQWPTAFGLTSAAEGVRVSFVVVAAWWLTFSIPLLADKANRPIPNQNISAKSTYLHAANTLRQIRHSPNVAIFLIAYWLYIDGVDTVIRMAVDYGLSVGLSSSSLMIALLVTQFVGFPAALIYGRIGERIGEIQAIFFGLVLYIAVVWWASRMSSSAEFFALAIAVGLAQGGIQALSRALYSKLIPATQAAEYFGLYNMLGKFAAILGPLLVGWFGYLANDPRAGILSLLVLFIAGGALLLRVRIP